MSVVNQSILDVDVDVITNAANENLCNMGGIARVILNAAGVELALWC